VTRQLSSSVWSLLTGSSFLARRVLRTHSSEPRSDPEWHRVPEDLLPVRLPPVAPLPFSEARHG
jgi:hypothetical protein